MKKEYQHNPVFQKLVKDEKDMIGFVAFSLIEEKKLLWINDYVSKGKTPKDKDITKFVETHTTDNELQGVREHAELIVRTYVDGYKKHVENECYNKINEKLNEAISPLKNSISTLSDDFKNMPKEPSLKAKYGHGIAQSMLGAVILAMIIYYVFPAVKNANFDDLLTPKKEQPAQKKDVNAPSDSLPSKEITLQPQKSVSS